METAADIESQIPQLWENYKLSSADGISLTFLFVWFIGDLTNLVGSVWARLVPTVIALAIYFCIADSILILQCLYYKFKNDRKTGKTSELGQHGLSPDDPTQPLIRKRTNSSDNIGLPGSRRRSSATGGQSGSFSSSRLPIILEEPNNLRVWLTNILAIVAVCVLGSSGWFVAWKAGAWQPLVEDDTGEVFHAIGAEILGYISAVAYLGYVCGILVLSIIILIKYSARIPQIRKNYREKSCEGK